MPNIAIATPTQKDYELVTNEICAFYERKTGRGKGYSIAYSPETKVIHFDTETHILRLCDGYCGQTCDVFYHAENGLKYLQFMNNEQRSEVISKESLRVGDFILDTDGNTALVLAIHGDLFARSLWDDGTDPENHERYGSWVSFWDAAQRGYKIQLPPTAPVKMTVAEIAKKLGHEVEVVK